MPKSRVKQSLNSDLNICDKKLDSCDNRTTSLIEVFSESLNPTALIRIRYEIEPPLIRFNSWFKYDDSLEHRTASFITANSAAVRKKNLTAYCQMRFRLRVFAAIRYR